jgi:glycerophosphoryl diester phosphodiesterase
MGRARHGSRARADIQRVDGRGWSSSEAWRWRVWPCSSRGRDRDPVRGDRRRVYAADGVRLRALAGAFRDERHGMQRLPISGRQVVGAIVAALVLATAVSYLVMRSAWTDHPVLVIAHRGASADAPENTLAAFRRAGELGTDFVELDVQESLDGTVVVVHDSDLMKVGGSPLKIWEATAEQLRTVDIGSRLGPRFKDERAPTLAEALAACKGVSRVNIELKYYGHNERLEERVVEIVEEAGMADEIVTMSLNHDMVAKMEASGLTSGLLTPARPRSRRLPAVEKAWRHGASSGGPSG